MRVCMCVYACIHTYIHDLNSFIRDVPLNTDIVIDHTVRTFILSVFLFCFSQPTTTNLKSTPMAVLHSVTTAGHCCTVLYIKDLNATVSIT